MKIAINTLAVNRKDFGGGDRYLYHLLRYLAKIDKKNQYFIFTNRQNQSRFTINQTNFKTIICPVGRSRLKRIFYEQLILLKLIKKYKIDVFHGPNNILPITLPCPSVLTIQYMFSFIMPQDYQPFLRRWYFNTLTRLSARKATKIISVSEDNKKQIIKFLKAPDSKVKVVYHGLEGYLKKVTDIKRIKQVLNKYDIKKKYILCVANNVLNKNLERLVKAFNLLKERYKKPCQLVIVGTEGFTRSNVIWTQNVKRKYPDIIFTGYIDHKELSCLYCGAQAFILPSLCESFGIPLLEAMASGVPIVTSNITAPPEIIGEAGLKVNPYNIGEIAQALQTLITNQELKEKLINLGRERVKLFSWEKAAKETLKVFKEAYNV